MNRGAMGLRQAYTRFEPLNHFQRSLQTLDRVSIRELRKFSRTIPARKAIRRIANGVLRMPWTVLPPGDLAKDETALTEALVLKRALQKPNREDHNLYSKLVRAIIHEMCTIGFAAIERQPGKSDSQPFWLWVANGEHIRLNTVWEPDRAGVVPRYYDVSPMPGGNPGIPLMAENLFIIQPECNTYELVPPSPLEVAYRMIQAWMGIGDFQQSTTTQAVRDYILVLKGAGEEDVKGFREYWKTEIEGTGDVPILGGDGVDVVKLGAKNDEELYPKYAEMLLRLIALAFDLAVRDYNITESDNRATAGVAADATFQDAILPMSLLIQEHFQLEVIDVFAPGFELVITDTEKRSEDAEAQTASLLYEKKVITRNEARLRAGEETIDGGDIFFDGSAVETEDSEADGRDENNSEWWKTAASSQSASSQPKRKTINRPQQQRRAIKQTIGVSQLSLFG
jgi:hypothetical protein